MSDQVSANQIATVVISAAATALLEGKRAEAEAVLKLADEKLGSQQNLSEEIAKIGEILKTIGEQFNTR